MGLTVVTHTLYQREESLARCIASIEPQLTKDIKHVVLNGAKGMARSRISAIELDEFVAFVDDDDLLLPGALAACMEALETTNAGVACTNEQIYDLNFGRVVKWPGPDKSYDNVRMHPRTLHHLTVLRTSALDDHALEMTKGFDGLGIDWFLSASAALTRGAVHLPHPGYRWTVGQQGSVSSVNGPKYATFRAGMRNAIENRWGKRSGPIPKYSTQPTPV